MCAQACDMADDPPGKVPGPGEPEERPVSLYWQEDAREGREADAEASSGVVGLAPEELRGGVVIAPGVEKEANEERCREEEETETSPPAGQGAPPVGFASTQFEIPAAYAALASPSYHGSDKLQVIRACWDTEGIYVYQAHSEEVAEHAVEHQTFRGAPERLRWRPERNSWIKPSFAWMLYRSGFASKHGQHRILRIKLPHLAMAEILSRCRLVLCSKEAEASNDSCEAGGCKVQWDPERDARFQGQKGEPLELRSARAIQIMTRSDVLYSAVTIEDVTGLAHALGGAHKLRKEKDFKARIAELEPELPIETPYYPSLCHHSHCVRLGLAPGDNAKALTQLGIGKALCAVREKKR